MEQSILQNLEDGVLTITLNRPERLNAFNEEMHLLFHSALERAHQDEAVRSVLLQGAGRAFCAGQDLGDRNPDTANEPPDLEDTLTRFYNPAVLSIRRLPKPVICSVGGVAAGAGANIAFGCDIILASQEARFIQSFSKVGLVPDAGGSWLLPRLIGEARAKALAMTAEPLSAAQAQAWGLVWKCVKAEALADEAKALALELAKGATLGLGLTKSAIHSASEHDFEPHLKLEARLQGQAGRSEDYAEGVRAFLQKRPAEFKGR